MIIQVDLSRNPSLELTLAELGIYIAAKMGEDPEMIAKQMKKEKKIQPIGDRWATIKRINDQVRKLEVKVIPVKEKPKADPTCFINHLEETARRMIDEYPKGKTDSGHYWSSPQPIVVKRLERFYEKYKMDFTPDEIVDATQRYVKDNKGNKYMRLLKYFIYKADNILTGTDETSDLLMYLTEKDLGSKPSGGSQIDWTSEVY